MKAIILAAGNGSRLAPIGITRPKILIPITNRPLLEHHIATVAPYVNEVIIIIGPDDFGQQISNYIHSQAWPIPVRTAIQDRPRGTAHAYQAAASIITGEHRLLCLNGDDLYSPQDIQQLMQHEFAVLGQPVTDPEKWGILQLDSQGYLSQIIEKPTQLVGDLANTGAYLVSTQMFKLYNQLKPSPRGEYEITDCINLFLKDNPMKVTKVSDYWLPIGYPWHILNAHQKLATQPVIGKNVQLGHNTSITGSSVIGDNVVIGDNTIIASSTIMSNAVIGSNCNIAHSIIGQHATLESDVAIYSTATNAATVLSVVKNEMIDTHRPYFGAAIGDGAHIKPQVKIAAGCKIWPQVTVAGQHIIHDQYV